MKKRVVFWGVLLLGAHCGWAQLAHQAAAQGKIAVLDSLVRVNPDVLTEKAPRNGGTPMHYAAWAGQVETVKWLSDHGAHVDAKDPNGREPMAWAVSNGQIDVMKTLAAQGADLLQPNDPLGSSLHQAATSGAPEVIGFLISQDAQVNGTGRFGFTPLHYAVLQKKASNITALLAHGADPLAPNNDGLTPLFMAIDGGDTACVGAFLASGVSPNLQSAEGDTPLHAAVYGGRQAVVAALLNAGAEVNRPDGLGRHPLDIARSRGNEEVSMLLKTHGATVAQSRTAAKPMLPPAGPAQTPVSDSLTLTVIYDNTTHRPDLEGDWGFSVLAEVPGFHLLFDTGTKEALFLHNFDALNLDAQAVDMVMLSHEHGDHTGGLAGFLNRRTAIPVVVPYAFSYGMVRRIEKGGGLASHAAGAGGAASRFLHLGPVGSGHSRTGPGRASPLWTGGDHGLLSSRHRGDASGHQGALSAAGAYRAGRVSPHELR